MSDLATVTEPHTAPKLETTFDYLRTYGGLLGERIVESFPALYRPDEKPSPLLSHLRRRPLAAQTLAIMGVAKFLQNKDAAKIVAECGTGKTLMSIAACYVHAQGRPFTAITMCPPHLTRKWAREIFLTLPSARVFLIESMRNGGDPKKPHGAIEFSMRNGKVEREGRSFSLPELRRMGRSGWRKFTDQPTFFVISKERAKLGYFWRPSALVARSGRNLGSVTNPESGVPMDLSSGGHVNTIDLESKRKYQEVCQRGDGTKSFAPLWSADRSKIQRMAPLEFMGRYMRGWFDYAIADEMHQLAGDTAQGGNLGTLARISRKLIGLTGTMMGGYADDLYNILYRMDAPQMVQSGYVWGHEGRSSFQANFGVYETTVVRNESDNACSRAARATATVKRRPGCSPVLFGRFLMESTAFVSLEDIAQNLPSYDEVVVPVAMDKDLQNAYDEVVEAFKAALQEYKRNPSITSLMLQTLLCYPDHPFDFKTLKAVVPGEDGPEVVTIATPQSLSKKKLYAKEQALIDDIKSELAEGRRVQVYATYTGEHDVTARLRDVLEQAGFRVAVLKSSVPTERREQWYAERLKEGVEVVICHPKLVETGLDLLDFPSIYFYETGYSLHTLRQASRRSWRIGQKRPVRVKFFFYQGTGQESCVRLMGKKLLIALMMEGKFSGEGLDGWEENDDMATAMVRELLEDAGVGESADEVWKNLKRERANQALDPSIEEVDHVLDTVAVASSLPSELLVPDSPILQPDELILPDPPARPDAVFVSAPEPPPPPAMLPGLAALAATKPVRHHTHTSSGQMSLFG